MKAREYSSEWRWQRWKFRCFNRRNKNCDECATQVNSALHPSGAAKSSTSFGWGIGRNVTAAGWQVTLCDPIWHVISRSSVVKFCKLLYSCFTFTEHLKLVYRSRRVSISDFVNKQSASSGCVSLDHSVDVLNLHISYRTSGTTLYPVLDLYGATCAQFCATHSRPPQS